MAASDPREPVSHQFGTSQAERWNPSLDPASAPLDDRDAVAQLARLRSLADDIAYYRDTPNRHSGDWKEFFPVDGSRAALEALAARSDGTVAPHLALLLAWLEQAETSRELLNAITGRHLQFQMRRVLGFVTRPPCPDRVHLLMELKKDTAAIEIGEEVRFSAGRDRRKVEQVFRPVRSVVVNHARVESLCSVVHDGDRLRFAPIADSLDGLGASLPEADPRWPPFGQARPSRPDLPYAPVGFAIGSPLLRLAGGIRQIRITLALDGLDASINASVIAGSLQAYATTPSGWSGPHPLTGSGSGDQITLAFTLGASEPAVSDHRPDLHLQRFPAGVPIVQLLLKPGASYAALSALRVRSVQVGVEVSELRDLLVEGDAGTIDPRRPFFAFGALPVIGSRLHVGCNEALAKTLTSLRIRIEWQAVPLPSFSEQYAGYINADKVASGVQATVSWQDARGALRSIGTALLRPQDAGVTTLEPMVAAASPPMATTHRIQALRSSGSGVAHRQARRLEQVSPVLRSPLRGLVSAWELMPSPTARPGFVTITLAEDFLHADYRQESLSRLQTGMTPLKEPYTPKVQDLRLDYEARSDVNRIDEASEPAFAETTVQFFHVDAFGVAREHGWLTRSRPWAPQDGVSLLPRHGARGRSGELMIGISGIRAGDPLSLLVQLAEGTADPQARARGVDWSILADDAWRPLTTGELVLDTTRNLRRSGIVSLVLPDVHVTGNSRMVPDLVWLRAAATEPDAACDVIGVHANAVEAVFDDQGNDPDRLATPLPAGSIRKLLTPLAATKSVGQPYASFGGSPEETDPSLAQRASERLRHRQRAITAWDWERLVLQAFPSVARAKCVAHASAGSWQAPGHVLMLVVPDLRNRNAVDRLHPRVDLDTIEEIRRYLLARSGMAVELSVRNPR